MIKPRWQSIKIILGVTVLLNTTSPAWSGSDQKQESPPLPLTLKECVRIALETNPLPLAAGKGVLAAQEAAAAAQAPYYPDLGLQTRYAYWQQRAFLPSGLSIPGRPLPRLIGPTDDWMAGLKARYTLFDSGERRAHYLTAKARQGVAEEEKSRVIQDLVLGIHQGFYGLAAALETRQVAEKMLTQTKEHLRLAKERKAVGAVPLADVLRVQVETANSELALVRADTLVRISKGNLNTLMGLPPEMPLMIAAQGAGIFSPDQINLAQAFDQAVQSRPEMKAALKRIEVSKGGIDLAKSAYGPKLRAEGSYGRRDTDFIPRDEEWLAGISLEWPLFTGFYRQHQLAKARAELSKEEAETKQLLLKVRQEVWTAFSRLREAYEAVQSTQALVQDAQESMRLAKERYEVGAGTITDLLDAQTALARALATKVETEWDYHTSQAVFDRSIGRIKEDGRS
jgi:outer membrane protein TolC